MPIISADKNKYSPPEYNVIAGIQSDIPLVLVTRFSDFQFNDELLRLDKYILCNLCEFGWEFSFFDTPIFGENIEMFPELFDGEEWKKFDDFVKNNPPLITFQREMLQRHLTDKVVPIDYPFYGTIPPIQSKEDFNSRPISAFHFWGRSNEWRVKAHTAFWESGGAVCDNIYYFNEFLKQESNPNKWVSLHVPHFARHQLNDLLIINGMSKFSLSMSGCGKKCFRHAESPINSIMVMERSNMAWQFPWVDNANCVTYGENSNPVADIIYKLEEPETLYPIYVAGVENARNYQFDNYTRYLETIINKHIG